MKKLGRIQTFAIAGLSALALATPIALAQTGAGGGGQGQGAQAERHGKDGEFGEGRGHRGGDFGGRGGGRMGGGGMFRGIDLTEEQKTRLQQLHQSFGERTKALREQLRAKHEELRQAESGTTFNEALATQKLTEAASLQAKLMGEEFRLRQESLSILTPEQRTQLEQRREQFKGRRGGERRGGQEQQ